jgi:hypothetical protein
LAFFEQCGIKNIKTGDAGTISFLGEFLTGSITRLCGAAFTGGATVNAGYWTPTVATGGTAVQANLVMSLNTTTTNASRALIQSANVSRCIVSNTNWFGKFVTAGTTNNIRRVGMFDSNNGYFFELNGTSFRVVERKNGEDTAVTSFNGDYGTSYEIDTNGHFLRLEYGITTCRFFIDEVLLHTTYPLFDAPSVANLDLPCSAENINTGTAANICVLECYNLTAGRVGELYTAPKCKYLSAANTTTTLQVGAGVLHRVIVGGTGGTVTFYDNTAGNGTILGVIDISGYGLAPVSLEYKCHYSTGLTVVTSTGTAPKLTVVYE